VSRVLNLSHPRGGRASWHVRAELLDGNGDLVRARQCLSSVVEASVTGDVVVLHAGPIRQPSSSLVTFLLAAAKAARQHGAVIRVEPAQCPLVEFLRAEGLHDEVFGPGQRGVPVPAARASSRP